MQKRFIVFLSLSLLIFVGWNFIVGKFFPELAPKPEPPAASSPSPVSSPQALSASPTPAQQAATAPSAPVQLVAEREIKLRTDFWDGTLSNRGAVLNEWTVTKFTDGKIIDKQTCGVHLVTKKIRTEVGAPFP